MKIRVSESDLMLKMMESLGGVGVGLPFNDTYSSIQTGVVDGAENNMTSYIEMSFYEVAPYWTYDGHSYMPDMILASKQTMDKLSADDQQLIRDVMVEAQNEGRKHTAELADGFIQKVEDDAGTKVIYLTDDELKAFQDKVKEPIWPMVEKQMGTDAYNALISFVEAYEAGKK